MATPESLIEKANQRLRVANVGLRIIQRGAKLSLRGMFPTKTNPEKKTQQIFSLDIYANPAGIKRAENEAFKLSGLIALKEFNWGDYLKVDAPIQTVGEWIERFKEDYFNRRSRNPKSETTWNSDYWSILKRMDADKELDRSLLIDIILMQRPDSKTRVRACMVVGQLSKFAGIDFDPKPYRGSYSPKAVNPRDLPTDEDITNWYRKITDPSWQYCFGLMACYGLRNHELFNLDVDSLQTSPGILTVLDGKTGPRRVWPCFPEWWERWELYNTSLLPFVEAKNNTRLGARVNYHFQKFGFLKPYNLRHAWAIRTLEYGLDITLSAAQMGHSVQVHSNIYHYWISDRHHQKAFDILMARSDRPTAP